MKILVINSGSSSIKYQLFDMDDRSVLTAGSVEKIGEAGSQIKFSKDGLRTSLTEPITNHRKGLERIAELLMAPGQGVVKEASEITAVGHRVVHGGEAFSKTMVITEAVKEKVRELSPLAPLHNPPNLQGIEVAEEVFPMATQVAVFDTAFHQTMPARAFRYAIPDKLYQDHGLRAYGFHGTSHRYVAREAAMAMHKPESETNLITIHLGNGCSMAAVKDGKCIDTSMGLSPLPGLIMGTRSGDVDPSIIYFLGSQLGMDFQEIDKLLNKESGLKGLTGENDLRNIIARAEVHDAKALLALEMYTYRIRKYIGSYTAALGRLDAIVFTAGVGENSPMIREGACQGLEWMGISLDEERNLDPGRGNQAIHKPGSNAQIWIIPTNEELEIAIQATEILKARV